MKIRTRLTLYYMVVTATIFFLLLLIIYLFCEHYRSNAFFKNLKDEGITKANLFLQHHVDASTMQSVYMNNREFINEVEVAVYDPSFSLLYHDASQIDIIKETSEMIDRIIDEKSIEFYEGHYQAVGMVYSFEGKEYIITAAAYDGYGYENQEALKLILIILFVLGIAMLTLSGYLFARGALRPVTGIVDEVEHITGQQMSRRLPVRYEKDELGELSVTFNRMLDRLEAAFQSQAMFISNVSHELRTPLAALIAELELAVLKQRTPEVYEAAIYNALDDSRKIVRLIEGLLNLAKADYSPEQIKKSRVRLDELLMDASQTVLKANPSYLVDLVFEQESDDDNVISVWGNTYLLTTAFVNLIENNCKFSENKTSHIQIGFWNGKSIIRFSDTGVGMSEEDKKHIFRVFYRGENQQAVSGHGIGMALVQKIVNLHGGRIEVNSSAGEGTVYMVEFPHL